MCEHFLCLVHEGPRGSIINPFLQKRKPRYRGQVASLANKGRDSGPSLCRYPVS
jgi:hypothetical protein